MAKQVSYHIRESQRINERLRQLQHELPSLCTDYFRAIALTTSPLTRLAYAYDLRLFFRYLVDEQHSFANTSVRLIDAEDLQRITAREIAGFQEYLQQYVRDRSNATEPAGADAPPLLVQNRELGVMRKLCAVRSFFEYLFKNGLLSSNVSTLVPLPKKHSRPILYLEPEEVQRMLEAAATGRGLSDGQRSYQRATRLRDTAILMLFLGTGIRVSELVGIDLEDLDLKQNAFMVTRKGGNQTVLYFPQPVAEALSAYLAVRQGIDALAGHGQALFLSLQRRRITQRAVENLVKKYALAAAPLKRKLSPHKLRSTFGTSLYRQTGDIYLVADALGHSDINTTRRHYAAMSDHRRREAAKHVQLPEVPAPLPDSPHKAAPDRQPSGNGGSF